MYRFLGSLVLGLSLLTPVGVLSAQDRPDQDHHDQDRPDRAKAHEWNDNENASWHQYLKEHHKKDHDWSKASKREQSSYWKWRDQHPDNR